MWGKTRDITEIGEGKSTLDEVVADVAEQQGRTVRPDPEPEKGYYYRSDHFSFAKVGVPAFDPDEGIDYIGKPAGWGLAKRQEYTANDYHKPSDVIKPDWDLSGAVQDCELILPGWVARGGCAQDAGMEAERGIQGHPGSLAEGRELGPAKLASVKLER